MRADKSMAMMMSTELNGTISIWTPGNEEPLPYLHLMVSQTGAVVEMMWVNARGWGVLNHFQLVLQNQESHPDKAEGTITIYSEEEGDWVRETRADTVTRQPHRWSWSNRHDAEGIPFLQNILEQKNTTDTVMATEETTIKVSQPTHITHAAKAKAGVM
eukprot:235570-Rhodomonas_salina.1